MVCSVLVPMIQRISPDIHVFFYADDLLLYIPLPPAEVLPLLDKVFDIIKVYGYNVGVKITLDKSAFLLNGFWHEHLQARLGQTAEVWRQCQNPSQLPPLPLAQARPCLSTKTPCDRCFDGFF